MGICELEFSHSHRIHGTDIFTYTYHQKINHVSKFTFCPHGSYGIDESRSPEFFRSEHEAEKYEKKICDECGVFFSVNR